VREAIVVLVLAPTTRLCVAALIQTHIKSYTLDYITCALEDIIYISEHIRRRYLHVKIHHTHIGIHYIHLRIH